MSRFILCKKAIAKTNDEYTAMKIAKRCGKAWGVPVGVRRTSKGKYVAITDKILWEQIGAPQYHINMPVTRPRLGREIVWV